MSILKRVGRQASFYAVAEALSSLTGLISFPIFTRVFTQAQYGVMGLVDSTFKLAGALAGMGLRPAVVRLWGEFKSGGRAGGTALLGSTMLSASLLFGLLCSLLCIGALLLPDRLLPPEAQRLIAMAGAVVLFRNMTQMVQSIVQVQEKAVLRSGLMLAERYLALLFPLLFVLTFRWGLTGFFTGLLVAEGLNFLYCVGYSLRHLDWRPRVLDSRILKESVVFGIPLLGLNVSGFVTDWSDRYVLSYFHDDWELGLYTAGYNMCNYAVMFFVPALNSALIPVTMNAWAEKGADETRESLENFLRYYALVALPVVFGISAVAPEAIRLLASEKFVDAAPVVPWVLAGKVIQGAYYPFLAGLFLSKRTLWLAAFTGASAVLNLVLNFALIPSMGMMGAAITTFISFAFYVFGGAVVSQRYLRLRWPLRSMSIYFAAGGLMCLLVNRLPARGGDAVTLALKIAVGVLAYAAIVVALDPQARSMLRWIGRRLARRSAK